MSFYLSIQWKTRLVDFHSNISMETIFINTENSKTNEPHEFVFNFCLLDPRISNENVADQNLSLYCTWKNRRQ